LRFESLPEVWKRLARAGFERQQIWQRGIFERQLLPDFIEL
jgi:hypothetical protein